MYEHEKQVISHRLFFVDRAPSETESYEATLLKLMRLAKDIALVECPQELSSALADNGHTCLNRPIRAADVRFLYRRICAADERFLYRPIRAVSCINVFVQQTSDFCPAALFHRPSRF